MLDGCNEQPMRVEKRRRREKGEESVGSYPATQAAKRSMVCISVVYGEEERWVMNERMKEEKRREEMWRRRTKGSK